MCNLYTQTKSVDEIASLFREMQMPLRFPEGLPNLQPRDVAITDSAPVARSAPDEPGGLELVMRRWSWPGPGGKPVYNFRSEGREFPSGRCLIVAEGFYEFTAPADPKRKRKDRWLFTRPGEPLLGMAGLVRNVSGIGEAFTILTTEAGPDVAPYHHRQPLVLAPAQWISWLDHEVPAQEFVQLAPDESLSVRPAPRPD